MGLSIVCFSAVLAAGVLVRAGLADEPPPPPRFDTELNQPPPAPPPAVYGSPPAGYAGPLSGAPVPPAAAYGPPGQPYAAPAAAYSPPASAAYGPPGLGMYQQQVGRMPTSQPLLATDGPRTASLSPAFTPNGAQPWMQPPPPGWASGPPQAWTAPAPPVAEEPPATIFKPSQIIAWVGDQPIQVGDVMPMVEQIMAPHLEKLDPKVVEQQKAQIDEQKDKLMKQALESAIQTKLLYLDFLRSIPDDKRKEMLPKITSRAEEQFNEKQLPEAMKKAEVETQAELDAKLREFSSSLARQRQSFVEKALGQSVLSQKINYEPEITHQAMLDYYHAHAQDYELPARARWEKLTVRFDRFGSKPEAWAALGNMGNEILRGAPLNAVAQRQSQGVDASEGGYHDWTSRGSLASEVIDQAVFSLPAGRLSERLEDQEGFHIVRVIERIEAGRVPFEQAQVDIKETLRKENVKSQITAYVAKLKQEIPVWNSLDAPAPQVDAVAGNRRS